MLVLNAEEEKQQKRGKVDDSFLLFFLSPLTLWLTGQTWGEIWSGDVDEGRGRKSGGRDDLAVTLFPFFLSLGAWVRGGCVSNSVYLSYGALIQDWPL